jgi:hypothetical protein
MENLATAEGLAQTFDKWKTAFQTDLNEFLGFFDPEIEILDEDFPWRMNYEDFASHIDFHVAGGGSGLWEFFEWIPREVNIKVFGTTGHVSGFSTLRGKPRDAGFRQRFMGFTLTWYFADGRWRLVCWHQSVLAGRIEGASPS